MFLDVTEGVGWFYAFVKRFGLYIVIGLSLFFFPVNVAGEHLLKYSLPVLFGIIFAEFSVIEKARRYLQNSKKKEILAIAGAMFVLLFAKKRLSARS